MATETYDAIVVGAGHNGLVAACYLARAKRRVLVLERRAVVGGACVTEKCFRLQVFHRGLLNSLFQATSCASRSGRYGFEVLPRHPRRSRPIPTADRLTLGSDSALTSVRSRSSARATPSAIPSTGMLDRVARFVEPTLTMTPPDVLRPGLRDLYGLLSLGRSFGRLGLAASEAVEILTGPARPILDRWFESTELKGTLATDAIIGAMASPTMAGTGYVLLHHVMGETGGKRGVWGYVRGGMGDSPRLWPAPPRTSACRSAARPRWRASSCATAA